MYVCAIVGVLIKYAFIVYVTQCYSTHLNVDEECE